MRTTKAYQIGKYVLWGILGLAALAVFGFVVMWLWNWLVPELFNGPVIGYWQTVGLLILSKILFSGIGHGRSHDHYDKSSKEHWKKRFHKTMNEIAEKDKEVSEE